MLRAENISFKVGDKYLLHESSVDFEPGIFHVIMGANGAGKSTLLKLLAGDQKPSSGKIFFDERDLHTYTKKDLATRRAVLSQHYNITFPIIVNDIVMMGRYPYFSSNPGAKDISICKEAMELMNVSEFAERDYNTLSGGESQKVQMSRVLSQIWEADEGQKKFLFLDEPVSHLDVKYQYQLMNVAKGFCKKNVTVIAILHDINLALSFADRLLFMKQAEIVYDFNDNNEITPDIIMDIFGVSSSIIKNEHYQKPVVIF